MEIELRKRPDLISRIYLLNFIHIMKQFKCQIINKLNSYITLWY